VRVDKTVVSIFELWSRIYHSQRKTVCALYIMILFQ